MDRTPPRHGTCRVIMFLLLAALALASRGPKAWALPSQSTLRQTVPTRTPTKVSTANATPSATPTQDLTATASVQSTPTPAPQDPRSGPLIGAGVAVVVIGGGAYLYLRRRGVIGRR